MVTMAAATIRDFLKIGSCFTIFVALTVGFLEINVEDMSSGDAQLTYSAWVVATTLDILIVDSSC